MEQIEQTQKEKWKMFKQFMYNEIGLTKEDIRGWIEDTVKQEVENMLEGSYKKFSLADMVENAVGHEIRSNYDFRQAIADKIASKYEIALKKDK